MRYIDEKFKEENPVVTVEKIREILKSVGVEVIEDWHESGVDNCWSLTLYPEGKTPKSNGKGITKELARASAYAEFIERLQGGLFFHRYWASRRSPELNLQNFAPDAKYMTVEELEENGEWMDYIIDAYKGTLTRKSLAKFCLLYANSDDGKILTLPFYSLFEKKYVYLPIGFVDQIYAANGCCAGNTRDEAWVHGLSEILERYATLRIFMSGEAAPRIPEKVLERYPTSMNILNQIRQRGKFEAEVFDFSVGTGFPIIATRFINKENQSYRVNVGADPVLEIAIQRTLTEMMQGKSIQGFDAKHGGEILNNIKDFPIVSNVINQLENGSGIHTADFFANEITCKEVPTEFVDNSDKTNKELLEYMLDLFKKIGKPVYVRNFSCLGFPSYRFVVPGFSEAVFVKLQEILPEALEAEAGGILKDIASADDEALSLFMMHSKMMSSVYSRDYKFSKMTGLPMAPHINYFLSCVSRSYAAYRLNEYDKALNWLEGIVKSGWFDEETRKYFACVQRYISLGMKGVEPEKVKVILNKFFEEQYVKKLYENVDNGFSPYEGFLLKCDLEHCCECRYKEECKYEACKEMNIRVGEQYKKFVDGQDEKEFAI